MMLLGAHSNGGCFVSRTLSAAKNETTYRVGGVHTLSPSLRTFALLVYLVVFARVRDQLYRRQADN